MAKPKAAPAVAPTIIPPSVGRVVWYWDDYIRQEQPYAALVVYVHSDRLINISYFNHNGHQLAATSVQLLQEGDAKPGSAHCQWMPYQLGQAKARA